MTYVSKLGFNGWTEKILDSSMNGCLHPIRVIKYVDGKPASEEWKTAKQLPWNAWGRKKPLRTKLCPSCKKSYKTNNARKKLCYGCQEKKAKRIRGERCVQEREERKLNPAPKVRQKSKYS